MHTHVYAEKYEADRTNGNSNPFRWGCNKCHVIYLIAKYNLRCCVYMYCIYIYIYIERQIIIEFIETIESVIAQHFRRYFPYIFGSIISEKPQFRVDNHLSFVNNYKKCIIIAMWLLYINDIAVYLALIPAINSVIERLSGMRIAIIVNLEKRKLCWSVFYSTYKSKELTLSFCGTKWFCSYEIFYSYE